MNTYARSITGSFVASILLAVSAGAGATVIEEITVTATQKAPSMQRGSREGIAAHLQLNESQRVEIGAILDDARLELDTLRKLRHSNREALDALEVTSTSDVVALERLTSERGELYASTDEAHDRIRAEVDTVLSSPQQIRLADLLDDAPAPLVESSAVQFGTDVTDAD